MVAAGSRGSDDALDGFPHGMELVVARDLLYQTAVVLEQDKIAQEVQQHRRRQHAAHHRFQLVEFPQRIETVAVDGAPAGKAFGVGRERAHARFAAVGDDEDFVVVEDVGNLFLVGLDLVKGLPDVGVDVCRVFSSSSTSGRPLMKRMMSGRRVCLGP